MRLLKLSAILTVVIFISGFIFFIYEIIVEQGRRDVVSKYVEYVKLQVISLAQIKDKSIEIVQGSSASKLSPSDINQITCLAANKMVSDARKTGVNFIIAGTFSNPNYNISVYSIPLILIVVDASIFADKNAPMESQFSLKYATFLFRNSTEISVSWLKCEESLIAIPIIKPQRSRN